MCAFPSCSRPATPPARATITPGSSPISVLPRVEIDRSVEAVALRAQAQLARVGHRRLAPSDIVIAACAQSAGGGVLHYDRDYDLIAKHTALEFESEWLAPPGSLS